MENKNRIYKLLLGVVLIAELVYFIPDIKAQEILTDRVDTSLGWLRGDAIITDDFADSLNLSGKDESNELMNLFVRRYDEYAKECFADSNEYTFNMYIHNHWRKPDTTYSIQNKYEIDPGENMDFRGTVKKWVHRETTFEGFIGWLRKRGAKSN